MLPVRRSSWGCAVPSLPELPGKSLGTVGEMPRRAHGEKDSYPK